MRVLYVQYTNPGVYPPIVRGAQLLAESGADVLMLGTRVQGLDALSVDAGDGMRVDLLQPAPRRRDVHPCGHALTPLPVGRPGVRLGPVRLRPRGARCRLSLTESTSSSSASVRHWPSTSRSGRASRSPLSP